jgi:long-chain fatty acid transport protein
MIRFTRIVSLPNLSKVSLFLIALYGHAFASGFQLGDEYSTTEIGLAGAGGAAYAEDATTNFSNPAGMVNLKNPEFVAGGTIVDGSAQFNGQACGGVNSINALGQPINGCNLGPASANGGTTAFIPEFSYAMPLTDRLYAGITMSAPFGLSTDYGNDTALRYQATKSNIETIDINPGIAFKFNEQFSLGGGISAQRMSATLDNNFNLFPNQTVVSSNFPAPGINTTRQYTDSSIKNNADDWGWGWNLGALYQFSPGSRVGLSYRSAVQHDLEGTSKYSNGSGTQLTSNNGTVIPSRTQTGSYPTFKTNTSAEIELPATTTASLYQEINPQWAMLASIYYTQWSSVQNLTLKDVALINTQAPGNPLIAPPQSRNVTYPENFDNTWRYSLGTEYKVTDALTFRAGGSYDQSPVNNTDRTIRLPDTNRWEGALGAGYRINQYVKLDAAYLHVWFQDASINQVDRASSSIGTVDVAANLYSLQGTIDIV